MTDSETVLVRAGEESCHAVPGWRRDCRVARVDFEKLARIWAGRKSGGTAGGSAGTKEGGIFKCRVEGAEASNTFVFLKTGEGAGDISLWSEGGELFMGCPTETVFHHGKISGGTGFSYSTMKVDKLAKIVKGGRAMLEGGILTQGHCHSHKFSDGGLRDDDWRELGFSLPRDGRPALDERGESKGLLGTAICVPYRELDAVESSCRNPWSCYVDSSCEGVFFSALEIEKATTRGLTAGIPAGGRIRVLPEPEEGVPYRPAWTSFEVHGGGGSGKMEFSLVYFSGGQYISMDPGVRPVEEELRVRWRVGGGWDNGVFAKPGRYILGGDARKSHYVPPRTKCLSVWEQGKPEPIPGKCILSTEAGGKYTPRPPKGEYRRLVDKYGKDAVPRNFQKFKESQIEKKSRLVALAKCGGWTYIGDRERGEDLLDRAYAEKAGGKGVSWRVLRQVGKSDDFERDPTGEGLYVRLIPREEIFSTPHYLRRLTAMLRNDGWGFLADEIMDKNSTLRFHLFSLAVT